MSTHSTEICLPPCLPPEIWLRIYKCCTLDALMRLGEAGGLNLILELKSLMPTLPKVKNSKIETLWFKAAENGWYHWLKVLLSEFHHLLDLKEEKVNWVERLRAIDNISNKRALHYAVFNNYKLCFSLLIRANPNLNVRDNEGQAPLHLAACQSIDTYFNRLIELQANINIQDNKGWTPIFYAVKHKQINKVQKLIDLGAEVVDAKNREGLLFIAAKHCPECIDILLQSDIDVNMLDRFGRTILFHVNDLEIFQKLVSKGVNLGVVDNTGTNILHHCAKGLLSYKVIPHIIGIGHDVGSAIPIINKADFDINTRRMGDNVLHTALKFNGPIYDLIKAGADINALDQYGRTPIFYTIIPVGYHSHYSNYKMEVLIEHGADVNVQDNEGLTPLHYAAQTCYHCIKFLLSVGAKIHIKDKKDLTSLDYALQLNFMPEHKDPIVKILTDVFKIK
jgi:uncharacterized protein